MEGSGSNFPFMGIGALILVVLCITGCLAPNSLSKPLHSLRLIFEMTFLMFHWRARGVITHIWVIPAMQQVQLVEESAVLGSFYRVLQKCQDKFSIPLRYLLV